MGLLYTIVELPETDSLGTRSDDVGVFKDANVVVDRIPIDNDAPLPDIETDDRNTEAVSRQSSCKSIPTADEFSLPDDGLDPPHAGNAPNQPLAAVGYVLRGLYSFLNDRLTIV